ncbi:hypothetical protein EVAR_83460_1 [Eumeta japonica]|uniref:Uncharacterized protein n=1 Tax=Eumeta variegata TaxID=151549 RepID=A0A4C1TYQ3_EUMVA|nr:hypothetical protein EVAR_83460_1 [Eumeta japonica]
MQAARHRGHTQVQNALVRPPRAYRTLKCPTRRAYHAADGGAPTRTSWEQLFWCEPMLRGPSSIGKTTQTRAGREEEDTGSLTHAASRAPALVNHHSATRCPHPPLSACSMTRPRVARRHRIEDGRPKKTKKEEGGRRWVVIEERRRGEGRGSLTRTALAAAVRRVDSLISGRQARSVRSTPTRVTDACRLDPVGVHQRPTTGGRLRVQPVPRLPPALGHYLLTTRCPPT